MIAPMPRLLPLALLAALPACATTPKVVPPGRVAHTVYFWLAADAPPGTAEAMVGYYRTEVQRVAGVESVAVGVPRPSDRDVVEDGFAVGATTVFASGEAEVAWQTDPIHDELRRRFLPSVERVVVYDTAIVGGGR